MKRRAADTKRNVLGVLVDDLDYEGAVERTLHAARERRSFAATALAVHGVMTGVLDAQHRHRLNSMDLVTCDGQPVRWFLNAMHRSSLRERVYGPTLMLQLCRGAAHEGLPVFLFGSTNQVLESLADNLVRMFPDLQIAGREPSCFRQLNVHERVSLAERIQRSGAQLVFVGLGCPRQETFVYEMRDRVETPLIAVGAAFDFHAGLASEPPGWVQRAGLQWLQRLLANPRRLWRRYVLLNPLYIGLCALQLSRLWRPDPNATRQPGEDVGYG